MRCIFKIGPDRGTSPKSMCHDILDLHIIVKANVQSVIVPGFYTY